VSRCVVNEAVFDAGPFQTVATSKSTLSKPAPSDGPIDVTVPRKTNSDSASASAGGPGGAHEQA